MLFYDDEDAYRNAKHIETLAQRVNRRVGSSDIEAVLLQSSATLVKINDKAYETYGVAGYRSEIESELGRDK